MRPVEKHPDTLELFRSRLENIIDLRHELCILSKRIDWQKFSAEFLPSYSKNGRPAHPVRLMVGLHILKHTHGISDEEVCNLWRENPYWQYFCGEEYFQHKSPISRSDMTHFRKRVGDERLESLLIESLQVALKIGALKTSHLEKVVVDTTVQEKAISFPTDSKNRYRAIRALAQKARKYGINLRQTYLHVGKKELIKSQKYRHAKQVNRAKKHEDKLKIYLGRIIRDVKRKIGDNLGLQSLFAEDLRKAEILHNQEKDSKEKIFSWHAPEVECIGKGKAHKPWEFGNKVSLAINVNPGKGGHFICHTKALHGKPFDGHTLKNALDDIEAKTGFRPVNTYVDRGYRGHDEEISQVFKSGQKRGVSAKIKRELKRRSAIEPIIGHVKNDGMMGRNYLKGRVGDRINAVLSSAGFNFRQILRFIKSLYLYFVALFYNKMQKNTFLNFCYG